MRLDVEAPKKCFVVCASRRREPSLSGDDTHAEITHLLRASEHGPHIRVWFIVSVGCEFGPSVRVQIMPWATPTFSGIDTQKERESEI